LWHVGSVRIHDPQIGVALAGHLVAVVHHPLELVSVAFLIPATIVILVYPNIVAL
jgi:hypothetical protein